MSSTWSPDVAIGDLDGDNDLDIFFGSRDEENGSVWLNDGTGHFSTDGIFLGNPFILDIAIGDLDGDNDLDIIQAGIQENTFLKNNGDGTFSEASPIFENTSLLYKVVLADLDGDGDLDAITGSRIWWNAGTGKFLPADDDFLVDSVGDFEIGDLDNDGDFDIVLTQRAINSVSILVNQGNGNFIRTQELADLEVSGVELGDLDMDGDLDAFFTGVKRDDSSIYTIWLNDGNGSLTPGQSIELFSECPDGCFDDVTTLGDLDGDGDLDAFSGYGDIYLNQGDATFTPFKHNDELNIPVTTWLSNIALGDLNGDQCLDVIVSTYGTTPFLWINQPREK